MKKKWIYLAVAALVVGGAVATATAHKGSRAPRMPRAVMHELELSDEQKEQLKTLRQEHREAMRALRDGGERPAPEEMRALFAQHREKVDQVLTAKQREQMEEMRGDWAMGERPQRGQRGHWGQRGHMGRNHRGPGAKGHPMAKLDLSDEQREKMKELRQKQRQELRDLTKKHRAAMEKVLTKDQREKLEEMKDEAFYGRVHRGGRM